MLETVIRPKTLGEKPISPQQRRSRRAGSLIRRSQGRMSGLLDSARKKWLISWANVQDHLSPSRDEAEGWRSRGANFSVLAQPTLFNTRW